MYVRLCVRLCVCVFVCVLYVSSVCMCACVSVGGWVEGLGREGCVGRRDGLGRGGCQCWEVGGKRCGWVEGMDRGEGG